MNNEIYKIEINNGLLEIKFLNNCTNNSVLFENGEYCFFKNNTYDDINNFNEFITVLSKCISIFVMLNSLLVIIYIFIISKIKSSNIGYINDVINICDIKDNKDSYHINEIIKN